MSRARSFDVRALERRYAFLDQCPPDLRAIVTTLPIGSFEQRVLGVRAWWDALLAGRLPPAGPWPPETIAAPARKAIEQLDIARFCKDRPDLVTELMRQVLNAFARASEALEREVSEQLAQMERLERERPDVAEAAAAIREKRPPRPRALTPEMLARLRTQTEAQAARTDRAADEGLIAAWGASVRAWSQIAEVFDDLGNVLGRGWDLSQGLLRHVGWQDLVRLKRLVDQLPQLRDIVRSLGRLHTGRNEPSVAERVFVPVRRLAQERREVDTPLVPMETRGVERSGEVARMLPVEAVMLGHPKLRLLWHARRAERALVTYRVEGTEEVLEWVEQASTESHEEQRPRPERGPIVAVLDTSGSMHGVPETVAKALVLEAVRIAHAEQRRCFLFIYSGPGQVHEYELDLSTQGIERLLDFLGYTFGGGNDETGVMKRVVKQLVTNGWDKADVVFVSDGQWPATQQLVTMVDEARQRGTRFHGVQIGHHGRTGLHEVCDPVHEFRDWIAASGWE